MHNNVRNIGAHLLGRTIVAPWSIVAAGSGDNTAKVGVIIDLMALPAGCRSLKGSINFTTTLAATETLGLKTFILEHGSASNLSDAATFQTIINTIETQATGPGGGGTVIGQRNFSVDLTGCKRYIRFTVTPDLSASGTDVAVLAGSAVFGGSESIPLESN